MSLLALLPVVAAATHVRLPDGGTVSIESLGVPPVAAHLAPPAPAAPRPRCIVDVVPSGEGLAVEARTRSHDDTPLCSAEALALVQEAARTWRITWADPQAPEARLGLQYHLDDAGALEAEILHPVVEGTPDQPGYVAVTPPTVRRRPRVSYPETAPILGIQPQACEARFQVDARGRVQRLEVQGCHRLFQDALKATTYKWRFRPATRNGEAVASVFVLRVDFRMRT